MPIIYHVTERKNAEAILRDGIRPTTFRRFREDDGPGTTDTREVWFFRSRNGVLLDGENIGRDFADPVVVRVTLNAFDTIETLRGYPETWGFVVVPEGNLVRPMKIEEIE